MQATGTLALAALLLGVPLVAGAQSAPTGSLTGRIVAAATGQPVADAVVALDGSTRQAQSNSLGRFRLDSLAPGIYTVRARAMVPAFGLASVSVARSEFTALDGQARAGAFDGRVIGALLIGWRPSAAWELSGKFRLASGLPTTPFITTGVTAGQLDFTRYNAGPRLPVFHALDLRGDRRWSWRGVQLVTYLDGQNIYARKNVSQLVWNERKQKVETDDALGILPSIGVNLEF